MISQTYDDWKRMLQAVAIADLNTVETVRRFYLQRDNMADGFLFGTVEQMPPPTTLAVARALGIDRRRRMRWGVHHRTIDGDEWAKVYDAMEDRITASCFTISNGMWAAQADGVCVTGHPSRESAIEHLERLLGRDGEDKP